MELDIRRERNALIVAVQGSVIAQESVRLGRELEKLIREAPDEPRLIVNLAGVPYLDSQGLGAVVRARQVSRERGGFIALSEAPPNIERLFTVAKLTDIIPIHPTDDEALDALTAMASES